MFFTTFARVVAVLALVFSLLMLAVGASDAGGWLDSPGTYTHRYWPTLSPGQMIDRGVYTLVFAVVLGTLAEIALGVSRLVAARAPLNR